MADSRILAVDLDGSLLNSDLLFECFWSALANRWTAPLHAARALAGGKARLKRTLAGMAQIDVGRLPYNEDVIAFVRSWRESGGRAALVTASDHEIAQAIADHLGIFDEVHGSDGVTNLKGPNKTAFLEQRYGKGGFAYIGNCPSDLPVWRSASRAICVGPDGALRRQVLAADGAAEFLERPRAGPRVYLRALRWHQWSKNLLVFVPLLAGHDFSAPTLLRSLLAAIAFSLIASSVYVLNDLLDLGADRAHPRKRLRPFASGAIPIAQGGFLAAGCLAAGFALALALGWWFVVAMLSYYVLTTLYSLDLKRRVGIDICALAVLYTMRVLAGGVATGIPLSVWLLAFALFFFFALASIKRQAELIDAEKAGGLKAHGRGYQTADIAVVSQMATASGFVSVLVMALYVNSDKVTALYNHPNMLWGICIVLLYWISRVIMVTHRGHMHDDPVVFAAKDRVSLVCGLLVGVCALAGALP